MIAVAAMMPPWLFMWALAASIFAGLKWLTWADREASCNRWKTLAYLLLWPGMDAEAFLGSRQPGESPALKPPTWREWGAAAAKCGIGLLLVAWGAAFGLRLHPLVAGWIGLIGLVFVLHFGLFHLLSVVWRSAGIQAQPIMQTPLLATSLSDFWGRRWNLAFRDLAHAYVFRQLTSRLGPTVAMLAVFLASGVVHDLVITLPAEGGYGGPTVYFLLQGAGLLVERSRVGRRLRLGRGLGGRLYCGLVVLLPLPLLFPAIFVERIVLPFLAAMGVMG